MYDTENDRTTFLEKTKAARLEREHAKKKEDSIILIQSHARKWLAKRNIRQQILKEFDELIHENTELKCCKQIYQLAKKFLWIWNKEEDKTRFEYLCRYINASLDSKSPSLSYIGVFLIKEHTQTWIAHIKNILWKCCLYLSDSKIDSADMKNVLVLLHTLVSFTSTNTWSLLKNNNAILISLDQLCHNFMGHLYSKGFYSVLKDILMKGLMRSKITLKNVALSGVITLATRPLISSGLSDKLIHNFLTHILCVPALMKHLEQNAPLISQYLKIKLPPYFFLSQDILMKGLMRSKITLKNVALSGVITLATRPLISSGLSDKLIHNFLTHILCVPALMKHLEQNAPLCLKQFENEEVLKRCLEVLSNQEEAQHIFNKLEGNYVLCMIGNLIHLSYLQLNSHMKEVKFPLYTVVLTRLLSMLQEYVSNKQSNLTTWHPILGWFAQTYDPKLTESLPLVKSQLFLLWSDLMVDSLLTDPLQVVLKSADESAGTVVPSSQPTGSSNIIKICIKQQTQLIVIHRKRLLEDGYRQLAKIPPHSLKGIVRVRFINVQGLDEAGIDQDGVFKEFLEETIKCVFDPGLNLFKVTSEERLYPSPTSYLHDSHLQLFEFVGRMLGKAVFLGVVVLSFFLSQVLGYTSQALYSCMDELPSLDTDLYRSLTYVKHYPGDVTDLDLTFSVDEDVMGRLVTHELTPGGKVIPVTNQNKINYIHLMAHFRMHTQIKHQTTAFIKGFKSIINPEWLSLFSTPELQRLISGDNSPLDLTDLRRYTVYYGGFHDSHKVVLWLWDILNKDFNEEERKLFLKFVTSCSKPPLLGFAHLEPPFSIRCVEVTDDEDTGDTIDLLDFLLLQFVTSCSKPPLLGFAHLEPPFSIRCVEVTDDEDTGDTIGSVIRGFFTIRKKDPQHRLPTASTCFNLLKLPNYQRKSTLRDKLRYAITSNTGFELS
ncbi:ubiquitin-protein ligase E3B [Diaphorina citri]|uniref:HECT-type E3 ubiquitin transferase n=1 Tax=Diaphorina citri TaxID=121845 RepID=A0A3Q0JCP3_DIACI|nr:ubiquitin-protein ligase E3B [Diaphorina citri]